MISKVKLHDELREVCAREGAERWACDHKIDPSRVYEALRTGYFPQQVYFSLGYRKLYCYYEISTNKIVDAEQFNTILHEACERVGTAKEFAALHSIPYTRVKDARRRRGHSHLSVCQALGYRPIVYYDRIRTR